MAKRLSRRQRAVYAKARSLLRQGKARNWQSALRKAKGLVKVPPKRKRKRSRRRRRR